METRSNHILVGGVVLGLLAAVMLAAFWFSRISDGNNAHYDIYFAQAVNGINKGSTVTYAGVPMGQVKEIELWERDPNFVRVRVALKDDAPILQGTTATIQSSFTGISEIVLDGAVKGAPPISCPEKNVEAFCPDGVPVIPTKQGALGQLLNSAPQLMERLSTLTERLTQLLDDKNQKSISGILANVNSLTSDLARRGPEIADTLAQARITVQKAGIAIEQIGKLAGTTDQMLNEDGRPMIADLRQTIQSARRSLDTIDKTVAEARPGVQAFSNQTMPEVNLLVRDLREMSRSLKALSEKIDERGAGSVVGGPALPDYKN